MTVGEFETSAIDGSQKVSRFAADFHVQFFTHDFQIQQDPAAGLFVIGPALISGDWYEGSLRFHSSTPAFALLDTVIPEPSAVALLLVGLPLVLLVMRRRR